MNIFNRIFNIDECSSTKSPANYFNNHPYESSHHRHVTPIRDTISTRIIQLTNCRLVRNGKLIKDDLWFRDGRVLDPLKVFYEEKRQADVQIDCDNLIIAPGFIDVQLNGAFGRDFTNDPDVADCLATVSAKILQYGVTAYCPTVISSHPQVYANLLPQIKRTTNRNCGQSAQILGLHLEGPFISKQKPGAHDQTALTKLEKDIGSVEEVYGMKMEQLKEIVSIITLAPELDPTGQVVRELTKNNIIVSIGHSEASLSQGEMAMRNGARFITHLFNAMLPFHHRDPHLIGLLSDRDFIQREMVFYGIIADNIHTHPSAMNIAYKAHPKGLVLVTDAISAMGLEEGIVHHVGNQSIEIVVDPEHKRLRSAYLQGTHTLCGSVATIDDCVRNLMLATECSLVEAIECASEHPAKLLGVYPTKGTLDYGADADFVILDEAVNVKATFVNGDLAWSTADWLPLFKYKFIP